MSESQQNTKQKKKIVLITDIFTPHTTRSSTQLLTQSVIFALSKLECDLFVVGIYDFRSDKEKIELFLNSLNVSHILVPSKINTEKNGKYKNVFLFLKETLFPKVVFNNRIILPFVPDKIISMIPSIEAYAIGYCLKKKYHCSEFLTMWTDVLAYNYLDSPTKLPFSRLYLKFIENVALKNSDVIFYLGESQSNFMKIAYPKYSKKMNFYYPSYYPFAEKKPNNNKKYNVTYFGNMNKKLRDVSPLCNAAKSLSDYDVLKIKISDFEAAMDIESNSDISIVFMNKHGFSIPGKIFYYLHFLRNTLIIKDGPFQNDIEKQLAQYGCFDFCDNDTESIVNAIVSIKKQKRNINFSTFEPTTRFAFLLD